MTEKDNQLEKSKTAKKEERKYFKIGATAFLTIAAGVLFFFTIYRWKEIEAVINTIIKSAEPIIIGMALAYLLMPVKKFVERPVLKLLLKTKKRITIILLRKNTKQALSFLAQRLNLYAKARSI